MRRMMARWPMLALIGTVLSLMIMSARAQEAGTQKKTQEGILATTRTTEDVYRVDYTIREMEGSKVLNSRKYMLMVQDQQWSRTRVGNRVPYRVGPGEGQVQYQNLGINIDSRVRESNDRRLLDTKISAPSIAAPDPSSGGNSSVPPVFRDLSMEGTTAFSLAKATLIGSMDDVTSNHRYEIEVTVTPVK